MRLRALVSIASLVCASGCELITRPGEVRFVDAAPIDSRADGMDSTVDSRPPPDVANDASMDASDTPAVDVPEDRPVMVDGMCIGVMCGTDCVDLANDPMHCGNCATACPGGANASPGCTRGLCYPRCNPGFANCNNVDSDGCEVRLDTVTNCGLCGRTCSAPNATSHCNSDGSCGLTCSPGFGDCDANPANGCETVLATSDANCGVCGNACPADTARETYTCVTGSCQLACAATTLDCDGTFTNGCETDLVSDANCGACGTMCASPRTCQAYSGGPGCCINSGRTDCGMGCTMGTCHIIFGTAWCCL